MYSFKFIIFLFVSSTIFGQGSEIRKRIDVGELKMTFPSIYFKHNSTEYAKMPYTVDSCLKHIATHIKDVTGKPIWRDSAEAEQLTHERIKKIKSDLSKYTSQKLAIGSMKTAQKLSRRTINLAVDSAQTDYLLSLNSVFDIAKTRFPKTQQQEFRIGSAFDAASIKHRRQVKKQSKKKESQTSGSHGLWIFGTCFKCIILTPFQHGTYLSKQGREHCRMDRKREQKQKAAEKK
jgi:hypothetical protein